MRIRFFGLVLVVLVTLCLSCTGNKSPERTAGLELQEIKPALDSFTQNGVLKHIQVLASDEFEGRAPGSRGEELTVNYLTEQFRRLGLKPGNPDGTYIQKVPLVGFTAEPRASFTMAGKQMKLKFPDDYVAVSR